MFHSCTTSTVRSKTPVMMSFQVLEWPSPVRSGVGSIEGASINSVAMDPEFRYLIALSDKNMVVIWKRVST